MIDNILVDKATLWLGKDGVSFFSHLKGLTGTVSPVLTLNMERKGVPTHPVHFREGMSVRNWMREQDECKSWSSEKFDDNWIELIEKVVAKDKTPESFIQKIATHLGKTIPETLEHIEKFSKELDKLKNKENGLD